MPYKITKALNKYYKEIRSLDIDPSDRGWLLRDFQEGLIEESEKLGKSLTESDETIEIKTPSFDTTNYEEFAKAVKKAFDVAGISKN